MKAIQIFGVDDARLLDVATPEPPVGEVLVEVKAVTTCPQWDMHLLGGVPMFGDHTEYPYTLGQPGHEMSGVVASVGAGVDSFREGDRVVAWRDAGHHRQGAYAQYVCVEPANLLALAPDADFVSWAPFELAMCVAASFVHIRATTSIEGKRVGISGLGGSGLIAAQYAKAEGAAEVIGFDMNAARMDAAGAFGVDRTVNPVDTPPDALNDGRGRALDISLDCVGAKAAAEFLMATTSEIVAIFGVQREGYVFPADAGGLKLFGYPGHTREAADYAMAKVSDGSVDLSGLVSARMGLEEYTAAVEMLRRQEATKVCLLPNG